MKEERKGDGKIINNREEGRELIVNVDEDLEKE